jgi:hypothetical protein
MKKGQKGGFRSGSRAVGGHFGEITFRRFDIKNTIIYLEEADNAQDQTAPHGREKALSIVS